VREVQAFNRADENIENFRTVNAANRDANVTAVAYTSALSPILEAMGYLALAIVTCVGGLVLLGKISFGGAAVSLGVVIAFLAYVQRFNQPIQQISVLWTNIQSAVAGAERIFGLLDEVPEVKDATGAGQLAVINGRVEFRNVSAAFVNEQNVLCNVSFTAEPGGRYSARLAINSTGIFTPFDAEWYCTVTGMDKTSAMRWEGRRNATPATLPIGGAIMTATTPAASASRARFAVTSVDWCDTPTDTCIRPAACSSTPFRTVSRSSSVSRSASPSTPSASTPQQPEFAR
jgi:hypothetical protein